MKEYISFHPRHIDQIKQKNKRLTARYDFEKQLRRGMGLRFVDNQNSQIFGEAICMAEYDMTVMDFIATNWEYHRNYSSMHDFEHAFNHYYPEWDIKPQDELTIIEWGDTFSSNPYYEPTE